MKCLAVLTLVIASLAQGGGPADQKSVVKAPVIKFEEVFRLDSSKGKDFAIWSGSMTSVDVDAHGHMFVTDSGSNRILEFDANGKFLKQLGGRGNGPGEFQKLYDFRAIPGGGYFAFDNTQNSASLSIYDQNLNFKNRIPGFTGERMLQSAVVGPAAKYLAATWMDGKNVYSGVVPLEGAKALLTLSSAPRPVFDGAQVGNPEWFAGFLAGWLKIASAGVGMTALDQDGNLYTANSNAYKISVYDRDLKPVRTITHTYKPKPMTEAHLDALVEPFYEQVLDIMPAPLHPMITPSVMAHAIELAHFPAAKQPIFGLIPMDNGDLLVVNDYDAVSGAARADLFDGKGAFLGNAELPPIPVNVFGGFFGIHTRIAFHQGHAYATVKDESGEFALVRYKYTIK